MRKPLGSVEEEDDYDVIIWGTMLLLSLSPSFLAYLKLVLIRDYFLKSILKWSSPSSERPVTFLGVFIPPGQVQD